MIAMLVLQLIKFGVPSRFAKPLLIGIFFLLFLAVLGGTKCAYDAKLIGKHDAAINEKVLKQATIGNDRAADARAADTINSAAQEQELHDAVKNATDGPPGSPSVRLGCQRLHNAGQDTTRIRACR